MSYYDDLIFLDSFEYARYAMSVNRHGTPERHWWEFTLNTNGVVVLQRGNGPARKFKGPVLFWHCHTENFYYGVEPGQARSHVYVVAAGSRMQRAYEHVAALFPEGYLVPDEASFEKLLRIMRDIIKAVLFRDERHKVSAAASLEQLIAELTLIHYQRHAGSSEDSAMLRLAGKIRSRPMENYDFEHRLAPSMGMSYSSFRLLFRRTVGKSPHAFLMDCRLQYALELLNSPPLQVKEIAARCGFENPVGFYRFFRKRMKSTPLEFRAYLETISRSRNYHAGLEIPASLL